MVERLPACLHACVLVCADLASRLVKAPPKRVAQLAVNTDSIAARLLSLRDIFPQVHGGLVAGVYSQLRYYQLGRAAFERPCRSRVLMQ